MRVNGEELNKKQERIIHEVEQEFKRKGDFELIYPSTLSQAYRNYFEEPRTLNAILYRRCVEKMTFLNMKKEKTK